MILHHYFNAVEENDLPVRLCQCLEEQTLKSLFSFSIKKSPELGHYVTQIAPMPQSLYKARVNQEIHMSGVCTANKLPKVFTATAWSPIKITLWVQP